MKGGDNPELRHVCCVTNMFRLHWREQSINQPVIFFFMMSFNNSRPLWKDVKLLKTLDWVVLFCSSSSRLSPYLNWVVYLDIISAVVDRLFGWWGITLHSYWNLLLSLTQLHHIHPHPEGLRMNWRVLRWRWQWRLGRQVWWCPAKRGGLWGTLSTKPPSDTGNSWNRYSS